MSIDYKQKLKLLHRNWPKDAVLTTRALNHAGFSHQLIQKYCKSGWLKRIGVGAFIRQNDQIIWQGALYAIQKDLKKSVHLGGLTALELSGLAHYLRLASTSLTYLYNTTSVRMTLPGWFKHYFNSKSTFHYEQCHLFNKETGLQTTIIDGLELIVSTPERAILELLYLVPKSITVEHAYNLVENLHMIRPDLMQNLLEDCRHILIKRLFLCLADLCQLPVMKYLDFSRINLGSGDRTLGLGGRYFPKYQIVIPLKNLDDDVDNIDV